MTKPTITLLLTATLCGIVCAVHTHMTMQASERCYRANRAGNIMEHDIVHHHAITGILDMRETRDTLCAVGDTCREGEDQ